ncbi:MAG: hypothetical protein RLO52_06370 [Sandaracinaceae bacterium]|nr:MAG: hypothetical protein EVA89_19350 [Sandaracinaceae bacterium]HBQ18934.1 hypothetical protein [Myxococcales bacterium]
MKTRVHPRRDGYREQSKPDRTPLTVHTVRPAEYEQPEWLTRMQRAMHGAWDRVRSRLRRS